MMRTRRTRSASASALLEVRVGECIQLRDTIRARRSLPPTTSESSTSSSSDAATLEGETQGGTQGTLPLEALSQATPPIPHNAWAGESFMVPRETPRRLLPAPVYRDHPTPGQTSVLNDELIAMRLMFSEMRTVMNELRECVAANTSAISQLSSPHVEHFTPPPPAGESLHANEGDNRSLDIPLSLIHI